MFTILTSHLSDNFEPSTNSTSNLYNLCIQNPNKTHFGALESPFICQWQNSKFISLIIPHIYILVALNHSSGTLYIVLRRVMAHLEMDIDISAPAVAVCSTQLASVGSHWKWKGGEMIKNKKNEGKEEAFKLLLDVTESLKVAIA